MKSLLTIAFTFFDCEVLRWSWSNMTIDKGALSEDRRIASGHLCRLGRLLVFLLSAFSVPAQAQFTYTVNNGTISITGYSDPYGPNGPLVIPETINSLPVTDIAGSAFYQHSYITSAVIGNNVTNIGPFAFNNCAAMRNLTIGNGVTHIGDEAFGFCTLLTNATLGSNVTWIDEWAFTACNNLRFITIPASVTNISQDAFAGCSFLTGIYFEGDMPNLETNALFCRIYYQTGTSGWPATYGGLSTVLWNPQIEAGSSNFGVGTNGFRFTTSGMSNMWFSVEACADLANPNWLLIQTNRFTSASFQCNDPQWTNFGSRFYRLRMP